MDDALRKRLDAIVILLVVIAALLALTLVGLGGGELLGFALLLGFVSAIVAYAILTGDENRTDDAEVDTKSTGTPDEN